MTDRNAREANEAIDRARGGEVMEHVVRYPFVRCKADVFDGEGISTVDSWRPGTEYGPPDPYSDVELYAHGVGTMNIVEVGRYKPGKYPERVFYTRTFTTPDGITFGKPSLRIATAAKFSRITTKYGYPYKLTTPEPRDGR